MEKLTRRLAATRTTKDGRKKRDEIMVLRDDGRDKYFDW